MHQCLNLLIEDGLCGDVWPENAIECVHFLSSTVHQPLFVNTLPHICILLIAGLLGLERLYTNRNVDLALNHLFSLILNFKF